jgi:hypothetical protein
MDHAYFYSEGKGMPGRGEIEGEDPFYGIYLEMVRETMVDLAEKRRLHFNRPSGFNAPIIYHAMGEGAVSCGSEPRNIRLEEKVATLHSNCVLSFDVEKTRQIVQSFYGEAAEAPKADL